MIKKLFQRLLTVAQDKKLRMTEVVTSVLPSLKDEENSAEKRPHDGENETDPKKLKTEESEGKPRFVRRKMALYMVYSGKGFYGMQRNPGARTIESDLNEAMIKAGIVTEEQASNTAAGQKLYFQRAARTDKGVSAAGQLCSMMIDANIENPAEKINTHLVDQIRVLGIQRVTKKFDSKVAADARTYMYLLPTFSFTPVQDIVFDRYRITKDVHEKVNETLKLFVGTKNFHNFTSGKKPDDPSARRYIISFQMGEAFTRKDLEFAVITIKGQSFMLHQIRKMIGLTIAIVRGLAGTEAIDRAMGKKKCDVPKAPGLGLMLDRVHYDYYNRRFGNDGIHEPISWEKYASEIDEFKEQHIYPTMIDTEIEEKSMLKWLGTLHLHTFDVIEDPSRGAIYHTPLSKASNLVKQSESQQDKEETPDKKSEEKQMDTEVVTTYSLENIIKTTDSRNTSENTPGDKSTEGQNNTTTPVKTACDDLGQGDVQTVTPVTKQDENPGNTQGTSETGDKLLATPCSDSVEGGNVCVTPASDNTEQLSRDSVQSSGAVKTPEKSPGTVGEGVKVAS